MKLPCRSAPWTCVCYTSVALHICKCNLIVDLISQGASVLFFPEGTRSKDGKMASFKKVRPLYPLFALPGLEVEWASSVRLAPRGALYAPAP